MMKGNVLIRPLRLANYDALSFILLRCQNHSRYSTSFFMNEVEYLRLWHRWLQQPSICYHKVINLLQFAQHSLSPLMHYGYSGYTQPFQLFSLPIPWKMKEDSGVLSVSNSLTKRPHKGSDSTAWGRGIGMQSPSLLCSSPNSSRRAWERLTFIWNWIPRSLLHSMFVFQVC